MLAFLSCLSVTIHLHHCLSAAVFQVNDSFSSLSSFACFERELLELSGTFFQVGCPFCHPTNGVKVLKKTLSTDLTVAQPHPFFIIHWPRTGRWCCSCYAGCQMPVPSSATYLHESYCTHGHILVVKNPFIVSIGK